MPSPDRQQIRSPSGSSTVIDGRFIEGEDPERAGGPDILSRKDLRNMAGVSSSPPSVSPCTIEAEFHAQVPGRSQNRTPDSGDIPDTAPSDWLLTRTTDS